MTVSTLQADLLRQITPPEPEPRRPAEYRYLICRASDGLVLDELPLTTTRLPRLIGTDSTTEFALPLDDPRTGPSWAGLVDPRRVPMVVVLRDDRPVWAGLITTQRGVSVLQLGAVTLEGWLARRHFPPPGMPITFEDTDQLDIARAIVDVAAGVGSVGDGLGMAIETPDHVLSGVARDRDYLLDEISDCLTELTQLANVRNGFEWTIEVDYTPGAESVSPRLVLGYPSIGLRTTQPEWRFELGVGGDGGNIVEYDTLLDCSDGKFATEVIATGAGEGESRLQSGTFRDTGWEDEIGLRVQVVTAYSTVKRQKTIDDHAAADLETLRRGESVLTARVRGDLDPMFGQYHLGDDARVVVEDSPRHPRKPDGSPGLDVLARIIGWTLDPTSDQVDIEFERVDL